MHHNIYNDNVSLHGNFHDLRIVGKNAKISDVDSIITDHSGVSVINHRVIATKDIQANILSVFVIYFSHQCVYDRQAITNEITHAHNVAREPGPALSSCVAKKIILELIHQMSHENMWGFVVHENISLKYGIYAMNTMITVHAPSISLCGIVSSFSISNMYEFISVKFVCVSTITSVQNRSWEISMKQDIR